MKTYITILGRSDWAVINTYYAVLKHKKFFPDYIYVITEDIYEPELEKVIAGLNILSDAFDFHPEINSKIMKEANFAESGIQINNLIKKLKKDSPEIAIDITSGRKALVAATLLPLYKNHVDYLFYLAIKTTKEVNKPYEMIPMQIQNLRDFVHEGESIK
ncbi:MAG: hypothetical protein GF329_03035 [Candidatus Lokiarchaeota archaeon]|nr:hypothetical protein [Candidatus Lokiarchaeota archaeon]